MPSRKKKPDYRKMHLQWFAGEAEEEDDSLVFEEQPEDDEAVEVIVGEKDETPAKPEPAQGDPEFAGKTREELIEIARKARESARPDTTAEAMLKGFDKLTNTLSRPVQAPTQQRDPAEVVREKIIDDPVAALDTYFAQKLQPDLQRIMSSKLDTSRRFALLDPETKWVIEEHGGEVEEEISRMPPLYKLDNPDVYKEACDRVKMRHVDKIVERQVAERLKKLEETKPKAGGSGGTYSEVPSGRPAPVKRTIHITAEQEFEEKQKANAYGIEWENWIKTTQFQKKYGGGKR